MAGVVLTLKKEFKMDLKNISKYSALSFYKVVDFLVFLGWLITMALKYIFIIASYAIGVLLSIVFFWGVFLFLCNIPKIAVKINDKVVEMHYDYKTHNDSIVAEKILRDYRKE